MSYSAHLLSKPTAATQTVVAFRNQPDLVTCLQAVKTYWQANRNLDFQPVPVWNEPAGQAGNGPITRTLAGILYHPEDTLTTTEVLRFTGENWS